MFKKYGIPAILAIVLGALYFYIALPAINLRSGSFWGFILFIVIVFLVARLFAGSKMKLKAIVSGQKPEINIKPKKMPKKIKPIIITAVVVVIAGFAVIAISSFKIFNAQEYQQMLPVKESDFTEDIAELPMSKIPIVDRDTAERLGSRKIGEVVELVSQFNVSDYYTQINYKQSPYRVSPLEYADFIKWIGNRSKGIPYYVKIDMATQNTELVELEEGMKYLPSEFFSRDLMRHVRFNYPTKMFHSTSFEIDDNGHPYWMISYYNYTIGIFGGKDIEGVICVDAVTGEMTDYKVDNVPTWVDRVYEADVVLEQAANWGKFTEGYFNSIFGQKNVIKTTDGYNYIAMDDDVWLFTGITSVVSDQSNIGFILINMRTKESRRYSINGAEEFSAMSSAEGKIQEKGYKATFPILVNIADTPSYFISLKDNAGLVKAYSFVSVANYQIVGVGDTIDAAGEEYVKLLKSNGLTDKNPVISEGIEKKITVERINSAVVNGNSVYYIKAAGSDTIYTAGIELSNRLPLIKENDQITIILNSDKDTEIKDIK